MRGVPLKQLLDYRGRQESAVIYGQIVAELADGDCDVTLLQTGETIRASRAISGEHYSAGEVVTLGNLDASGVAVGGGYVILGRPNGAMRNTTTPTAEQDAQPAKMVITKVTPAPLQLCVGGTGDLDIYGYNLTEAPTVPAGITESPAATITPTLITMHLIGAAPGMHDLTFDSTGLILEDAVEVRACAADASVPSLFLGQLTQKYFRTTESMASFLDLGLTGSAVLPSRMWAGSSREVFFHNGLGGRALYKVNTATNAVTQLLADSGYTPHSSNRDCLAWDVTGSRVGIIGTKASDATIRAVVIDFTGAVLWESASLLTAGQGLYAFFDGTDFWFSCKDNKVRRVDGATYAETVIATSSRPSAMATDGTSIFLGYDKLTGTDARLLGKISRATNVIDAAEVAATTSRRNAGAVVLNGGELFLTCADSTASNHMRLVKVNPASMAILYETLTAHTGADANGTGMNTQIALNATYLFAASTDGTGVVNRVDRATLGNLTTATIPSGFAGYNDIGNGIIWI